MSFFFCFFIDGHLHLKVVEFVGMVHLTNQRCVQVTVELLLSLPYDFGQAGRGGVKIDKNFIGPVQISELRVSF